MKRFNETYGKRRFLTRNEWADTYKAINSETEEIVILKVLTKKSDDEEYIKNLSNVVNTIKKIKNSNLININNMFQYVAYGKTYYYIESEHFKGITLKEKLENEKIWEKEAAKIVKDVATGINELHHKNILFNLINIENILINSKNVVKVNTLSYLKNKDFENDKNKNKCEFNPQKDIYDLGIMLYTLLSGKRFFKKNRYKNDISDENLAKIIEKATNKEKEPKYNNMNRFIIDLESYLSYGVIQEDSATTEEKKDKPKKKEDKSKRKKGRAKKVIGTCAMITLISGAGIYAYDFLKENPIKISNNILKIEGDKSKLEENNNKEDEKIKEDIKKDENKTEEKIDKNNEKLEENNSTNKSTTSSNKKDKSEKEDKKTNNSAKPNTTVNNSTTSKPSTTTTTKPSNTTNSNTSTKPNNTTSKPSTTTTTKPNNTTNKPSTTTTTKPSSTTSKPSNTTTTKPNVTEQVPATKPNLDNSNNNENNQVEVESPEVETESE